ncbi:MAG: FAD-binding protein [Clostridia bacterium]|nr:FAD-binding protein [Clostridia bacterium]
MANERYDVAIVGAGPAGALLASRLPGALRVLILDKSDAGNGFEKPCGGLLSEAAQEMLARLDITLPAHVLTDPQIYAVRTLDVESGDERSYFKGYVNMKRGEFDRFMRARIPACHDFRPAARVVDAARADGGFCVTYKDGARQFTAHARYLVGADGANSLVRRKLYPGHRIRSYTAIQQWFEERNPQPFLSAIFDPATSGACSWSLHKRGSFIFGGAFEHDASRDRFEEQKKRLHARFGIEFGEPLKTEACIVLRPRSSAETLCGGDGCFLTGEAAGFISPSSFEGISFALYSGWALATALSGGEREPNAAYRRLTSLLRRKIDARVAKSWFMFEPALRRAVLKSGLQGLAKL